MDSTIIFVEVAGSVTQKLIHITKRMSSADLESEIRMALNLYDGMAVMLLSNSGLSNSMAYPLDALLQEQDLRGRLFNVTFMPYESFFSGIRYHPRVVPPPGWAISAPPGLRTVNQNLADQGYSASGGATSYTFPAPAVGGSKFAPQSLRSVYDQTPQTLGQAQNPPPTYADFAAQPGFSHANTPQEPHQASRRCTMYDASFSGNAAYQNTEPSLKIEEDDGTVTARKPDLSKPQDSQGSVKRSRAPHGEDYGTNGGSALEEET